MTNPIAAIEVLGNTTTPTEAILQTFGKQTSDLWEFGESKAITQRMVEACGLRDVSISASHFPPHEGVFITLEIVETNAPVWEWRPAPTHELVLPAEIAEANEQRRVSFAQIVFSGPFTKRSVQGGRMRTETGDVGIAEDRLAALATQHHDALVDALLNASDPNVRAEAAEALAQAVTSQPLIDALVAALRDGDIRVRQNAANALQSRVWSIQEGDELSIPIDPLIAMLEAPSNHDRQTVGFMLNALAHDPEQRAYIRQHAEARLRGLARSDGPHGANFAQRTLDQFALDDPSAVQIDAQQTTLLAATISVFLAANSAADAEAQIDPDPAAPAYATTATRPYPGSFVRQAGEIVPPLDIITPHIVVAAENGRYRVLARREFGPNRARSLPPFSGELTWDGMRWWVWRADA